MPLLMNLGNRVVGYSFVSRPRPMNYKLKTRKAASKPYAVAYGTRGAEPEVT